MQQDISPSLCLSLTFLIPRPVLRPTGVNMPGISNILLHRWPILIGQQHMPTITLPLTITMPLSGIEMRSFITRRTATLKQLLNR